MNWWLDFIFQDFLVESRVQESISFNKAASAHYTTMMFVLWNAVSFIADPTGLIPSRNVVLSVHRILFPVLGTIKMFSVKCETSLCGFHLGTVPWILFLPSLVDHGVIGCFLRFSFFRLLYFVRQVLCKWFFDSLGLVVVRPVLCVAVWHPEVWTQYELNLTAALLLNMQDTRNLNWIHRGTQVN